MKSVAYESGGKKTVGLSASESGRKEKPDHVWWVFGGNGSVALSWVDLVEQVDPSTKQVFVLFDYPSYGFNRGRPNPKSIRQSVEDSIPVVAKQLRLSPQDLMSRSHVLGHSLGAAIALDTANRHNLDKVIIISPFTKMEDMARRQMGNLGAAILRHRYDNEKSIDALLAKETPPAIYLFHGELDDMIPIEMSRSLLAQDVGSKKVIEFHSVPRAGHNNIIGFIEDDLIQLLEK